MATRDELVAAVRRRYSGSGRAEKTQILDEFVAVTGHHRKHAMRLLRGTEVAVRDGLRPDRRLYDDAVREALIVVWEASDRVCSKRLKALIPLLVEAMERHGHLDLDPQVRGRLLTMSAATMDRSLRAIRDQGGGRRRRRPAAPSSVRAGIAVRTFSDWDDPAPGFVEADLVAHSGPVAKGSFVQTLVLTDIATGWTECAPLLFREQNLLSEVLTEVRKQLPFELLGFDTDNDSVFINETVRDYCRASAIEFTRCRPYRKNDQAFVEQKNGAIVRRMVGYRRFEGLEAAAALARLYASVRLFVNVFQPSFKLAAKEREGGMVRKRYHSPATPAQRLLADPRTPQSMRVRVAESIARLDPVLLLHEIRLAQQALVDIADVPVDRQAGSGTDTDRSLDQFLTGLRTAWKDGDVRPTDKRKATAKRSRRRPDPLAAVTEQLQAWFEAEPWQTSLQLLERLQTEHPGLYPDALLRTVQRRVKIWRAGKAHELVFGIARKSSAPEPAMAAPESRNSGANG